MLAESTLKETIRVHTFARRQFNDGFGLFFSHEITQINNN